MALRMPQCLMVTTGLPRLPRSWPEPQLVVARVAGPRVGSEGTLEGGCGGKLRGIPRAVGKGSPWCPPRFDFRYVLEPLESFPISPSGSPWGGGETGNGGSGGLPANPQAGRGAIAPARTVVERLVRLLSRICLVGGRLT